MCDLWRHILTRNKLGSAFLHLLRWLIDKHRGFSVCVGESWYSGERAFCLSVRHILSIDWTWSIWSVEFRRCIRPHSHTVMDSLSLGREDQRCFNFSLQLKCCWHREGENLMQCKTDMFNAFKFKVPLQSLLVQRAIVVVASISKQDGD